MKTIQEGSEEERASLKTMNGNYYLVLDPLSAFYRRLVYQEVESIYNGSLSVVKLEEDNQVGLCSGCHLGK